MKKSKRDNINKAEGIVFDVVLDFMTIMENNGITNKDLKKMTGLNLRKMQAKSNKITIYEIVKIAEALGANVGRIKISMLLLLDDHPTIKKKVGINMSDFKE